jgi:hypothetical protein
MKETSFILSMTVLPNRTRFINDVLLSACNQRYDNFEVHLNVPIETKFDGKFDKNFPFIQHPKLKIFFVEDVGAITKIYPTLVRTTNPSQRIIVLDDDFIVDPNMLSVYNYLLQAEELQDSALGFAGIYPIGVPSDGELNCVGCFPNDQYMEVGILEGYKTAQYRRDFFDDEFMTEWYKKHYNDDLTIATWLGYKGIKRFVVPTPYETNFINRMLSFPLVQSVSYGFSGVGHLREKEGGSGWSYKIFYNSDLGKYLK